MGVFTDFKPTHNFLSKSMNFTKKLSQKPCPITILLYLTLIFKVLANYKGLSKLLESEKNFFKALVLQD